MKILWNDLVSSRLIAVSPALHQTNNKPTNELLQYRAFPDFIFFSSRTSRLPFFYFSYIFFFFFYISPRSPFIAFLYSCTPELLYSVPHAFLHACSFVLFYSCCLSTQRLQRNWNVLRTFIFWWTEEHNEVESLKKPRNSRNLRQDGLEGRLWTG